MTLRIYVASSWRNNIQPSVVTALREAGHEVYDFKNPSADWKGFHWSDADPNYTKTNLAWYMADIERNPVCRKGFEYDKAALDWCNVCVLVLPCGRSAHLEAGYACGQGKTVIFMLSEDQWEPELMYLLGSGFVRTIADLKICLQNLDFTGLRNSVTTYGYGS